MGTFNPPSSMSPTSTRRFTLSLPFQIKSNISLFTSFTNSLSIQIKLARYKKVGIINVLTSWILPMIVRSLHFQILNLSLMVFVISSKLSLRLRRRSYVKYTPKIFTEFFILRSLKGVWLRLRGRGERVTQLPLNGLINELMNSCNYFVNIQFIKYISACFDVRDILLSK